MEAGERQFDVLVIGGGINGAGIARDAALRGLRVCLIEQGDICSETTRWSSRLIHGGLRYLEFGELGLVFESLAERERLLRHANHLIRPLPLLIPAYAGARRGIGTIDFGLWIYDTLSIGGGLPGHRKLSAAETKDKVPGLSGVGLDGGALYYDAQVTFVERLVVENVLAARLAGAEVLTHTRVEQIQLDGSRVAGVVCRDLITDESLSVPARAIVNAAGPWVDSLLGKTGRPMARYLGPTRGTHIVVPPFAGFADVACYTEARSDGRPFFVIPWNGMVLIGTTDLRHDGDVSQAHAEPAEIDYLLDETARIFPQAGLQRGRICYAYTGVRPLPRQGRKSTAAISRRHMIRPHAHARGLYSIIGGKITTYRNLAEQAVDLVASRHNLRVRDCTTAAADLPGGGADRDAILRDLQQYRHVPTSSYEHLWNVYGKRAGQVAALTVTTPSLAVPICPYSGAIAAEIVFALRVEFARTLTDAVFRRCMAGLSPDLGAAAFAAATDIARQHLGFDPARLAAEQDRYDAERQRFRVSG